MNIKTRNGLLLAAIITSNLSWADQTSQTPVNTSNDLAGEARGELTYASMVGDKSTSFSEDRYRSTIDEIEAIEGPYGGSLTQNLIGLGLTMQDQGNHNEAIEHFTRAVHINKINEGLYNLNQVPVLERLIESYVAQGNWEDANDKHQYLFWLHQRNFGNADPRMLPIINKLSNWHLNAYTLDSNSGLFHHLINAHLLFKLAVNIIDNNYGQNDLRLIEALRGLTVTNYFLKTFQSHANQRLNQAAKNGQAPTSDERARLEQFMINSYSSGKHAISRMVHVYSTNPEAQPYSATEAQVELADWYLLFNKWHSALSTYQDAYDQLAAESGNQEVADKLFSRPVPLPDLPLIDTQAPKGDEDTPYVLVAFDVTAFGKARNIEILESFPKDIARNSAKVKRSLKVAKFRPRFANGAPALTERVTHRYLFPKK